MRKPKCRPSMGNRLTKQQYAAKMRAYTRARRRAGRRPASAHAETTTEGGDYDNERSRHLKAGAG